MQTLTVTVEHFFSTYPGWTQRHRGGLPRDFPGTRFRVVVGVRINIRHDVLSPVSGAVGLFRRFSTIMTCEESSCGGFRK